MSTLHIGARPRTVQGRHLGGLRREGLVPAVVYGFGQQPQQLSTDTRTLERLWVRAGKSSLIDLEIDGGPTRKVLIREIQFNKRSGAPIHVDFYAPNLLEKTGTDVPVVLVGEAPAVALKLGMVLQVASSLKIEALPTDLPSQLTGDVSELALADAVLTAGEIPLPKGVTLLSDPGEIVAKIATLRTRPEESEDGAEEQAEADAAAPEGEGTEA